MKQEWNITFHNIDYLKSDKAKEITNKLIAQIIANKIINNIKNNIESISL